MEEEEKERSTQPPTTGTAPCTLIPDSRSAPRPDRVALMHHRQFHRDRMLTPDTLVQAYPTPLQRAPLDDLPLGLPVAFRLAMIVRQRHHADASLVPIVEFPTLICVFLCLHFLLSCTMGNAASRDP